MPHSIRAALCVAQLNGEFEVLEGGAAQQRHRSNPSTSGDQLLHALRAAVTPWNDTGDTGVGWRELPSASPLNTGASAHP